jgi:hypothetical protein
MGKLVATSRGGLYIGVGNLPIAPIEGRLAHDVVEGVVPQAVTYPFQPLEPDKGHCSGAVGEGGFQSCGPAGGDGVQVFYMSTENKVWLFGIEVGKSADVRAVYHAERKVFQKVAEGVDVQLFGEDVGTLWPDAFQVYDGGIDGLICFLLLVCQLLSY